MNKAMTTSMVPFFKKLLKSFQMVMDFATFIIIVADTQLYRRLSPSNRPSVGPSMSTSQKVGKPVFYKLFACVCWKGSCMQQYWDPASFVLIWWMWNSEKYFVSYLAASSHLSKRFCRSVQMSVRHSVARYIWSLALLTPLTRSAVQCFTMLASRACSVQGLALSWDGWIHLSTL